MGAVKSLHVPRQRWASLGVASHILRRGFAEFDSFQLQRFRRSARLIKTSAIDHSANLPAKTTNPHIHDRGALAPSLLPAFTMPSFEVDVVLVEANPLF